MNLIGQQKKVYDYLLKHGEATVRELFIFTNYPTCIIRDLREKGIKIYTVPNPNVNYEKYVLENQQSFNF